MSLHYALLGLLSDQPMSGYDLTKRFEQSLQNVWPASHSQIYPELNRLRREGLIEIVSEGPRGRKVYQSTAAGKESVHHWLTETEPEWTLRSEPMLRSFFLWMLEPDQARHYLRRYREHFRVRLGEYQQIKAEWQPETDGEQAAWIVLEAGIMQAEAAIQWADWALEQYGSGEEKG